MVLRKDEGSCQVINDSESKIVVLSAMSGTQMLLVQIAETLYAKRIRKPAN
ncbi:MAG: hypothetical protein U5J96_00665 [Ignavibacteriaceae bacterium]|nr:hypothetical protein [Ignavibacteriaceae bacterium]